MNHAEYGDAYEEAAFTQATNVSDQVQQIVNLSVNHLQVKLHLKSNGQVDRILKFVRPLCMFFPFENSLWIWLRIKITEVKAIILQI